MESRAFNISVFIVSAVIAGILLASFLYFNSVSSGKTMTTSAGTTMTIVCGIGLAIILGIWIWSVVVLFTPKQPLQPQYIRVMKKSSTSPQVKNNTPKEMSGEISLYDQTPPQQGMDIIKASI